MVRLDIIKLKIKILEECRSSAYNGEDGGKYTEVVWASKKNTSRFCSKECMSDGENANNERDEKSYKEYQISY